MTVRRGRGFTLLEVLVALVVPGLLVATLTQGVRFGLQAWAIEGRMGDRSGGMESTDRALRQLIERAVPSEGFAQNPAFTGTAHAVSFVTVLPEGYGAISTHEADASLLVTAVHRLELRWRPHYRLWIVTPPPPSSIVLLGGVERLDVSYWKPGPRRGNGRWLSTWNERPLPSLVRLQVMFPLDSGRRWPDIVVALMREAS